MDTGLALVVHNTQSAEGRKRKSRTAQLTEETPNNNKQQKKKKAACWNSLLLVGNIQKGTE